MTGAPDNTINNIRNIMELFGGERADNATTVRQTDSNNKTVSMYKRKKKKKVSKRTKVKRKIKRRFTKKVKNVLTARSKWNYHTLNFTNDLVWTQALNDKFTTQHVCLTNTSPGCILAKGALSYLGGTNNDLLVAISRAQLGTESIAGTEQNTLVGNFRCYFKATLKNVLFSRGPGNPAAPFWDETNPLIIDVYLCTAAKNITEELHATPYQSWNTLHIGSGADVHTITPSTMTGMLAAHKGNTPSMCAGFSKYWKIDQVTRHRLTDLSSGINFTCSTRGWYDTKKWAGKYAIGGITKAYMVVVAPVQLDSHPTNINMAWGSDKHFQYKVPGNIGGSDNMSISFTSTGVH